MEKDIQRRNVIDVLRSMDVGAIEVFPIVQKPSVTNTCLLYTSDAADEL